MKVAKGMGFKRVFLVAALGCSLQACYSRPIRLEDPGEYVREAPGVTQFVWEEPMTDVIDVPPGLDPEGHYYRPGHQEIVEIRQGRWEYYRPQAKEMEEE